MLSADSTDNDRLLTLLWKIVCFRYLVNGFPGIGRNYDEQVRLPAILGISYNAAL
jgi:hypothetical protein